MATDTAQDLINKAYKKIGVNSPDTAQVSDGVDALNNLLTSWSIEGLIIPFVIRENFTLTVGDAEYTIGSGADFDTVRPLKISDAYLKDGTTDYRLTISPLKEHNDVYDKTTEGLPQNLYYLAEMANGKILFDYEPDKTYELYIDSEKSIAEFTDETTTIASVLISSEYKRLIIYNLALEMASDIDSDLYDSQGFAHVISLANETKRSLKSYHASINRPKKMEFDNAITYPLRK